MACSTLYYAHGIHVVACVRCSAHLREKMIALHNVPQALDAAASSPDKIEVILCAAPGAVYVYVQHARDFRENVGELARRLEQWRVDCIMVLAVRGHFDIRAPADVRRCDGTGNASGGHAFWRQGVGVFSGDSGSSEGGEYYYSRYLETRDEHDAHCDSLLWCTMGLVFAWAALSAGRALASRLGGVVSPSYPSRQHSTSRMMYSRFSPVVVSPAAAARTAQTELHSNITSRSRHGAMLLRRLHDCFPVVGTGLSLLQL